jgi:NarL family two-component system sensor histidine kinase LiaS
MPRIRSLFQGLSWKLTLSYTLVTVATLLVVEVVGLGGVLLFVLNSNFMPRLASQVLVASTDQIVPYLDETPPDLNGLNSWLTQAAVNGLQATTESGGSMSFSTGALPEENALWAVLDTHQTVLAVYPSGQDQDAGQPFDYAAQSQLKALVSAALAGESQPEQTYLVDADRQLLIAAPIQTNQGEVLGVLVFKGVVLPLEQPLPELLTLFGGSLVFFTLAAGAVGTVFGFFTARTLSRRLHTVSEAADSWSRGDFSVFIQDRSQDELGQLSKRLNLMAEQLQNLLQARLELASLEERNRLARDLHDSVKQQVFATAMQVGAARALMARDPQAAVEHLDQAEHLARQAQSELNSLIRELHPVNMQGQGLVSAVRDYLHNWSQQTGISVKIRVEGERPLPLNTELALFRILQEALANVAKHSRATQVDLHLVWEQSDFTLAIRDNGRGFDPSSAENKGFGLNSMRERAQTLGANLDVDSATGEGTRIIIQLGPSPQIDSTKADHLQNLRE